MYLYRQTLQTKIKKILKIQILSANYHPKYFLSTASFTTTSTRSCQCIRSISCDCWHLKPSGSAKKDLFIGFPCLLRYHKHALRILQSAINQKEPFATETSFGVVNLRGPPFAPWDPYPCCGSNGRSLVLGGGGSMII